MPNAARPSVPVDPAALTDLVRRALAEDIGTGDVTAEAVVAAEATARAAIVQKQSGVVFGVACVTEAMTQCGLPQPAVSATEGEWREVPEGGSLPVLTVQGNARAILAAERVGLNLLGRLSGIATLTARYVEEANRGGHARILDTRKTTPGLRFLEKAAVAAGGGSNHRFGLYDAILIKENHAASAGGVGEAVDAAKRARPELSVEVECRTLDEVRFAIGAGADRILLDNMDSEQLATAVGLRDELLAEEGRGPAQLPLEASGGVNLGNVAEISATGVEFISVGALTHSAPALDFSLLFELGG